MPKDPLDNIPVPDELPGKPTTEDEIQNWMGWITLDLGKALTRNGKKLHNGEEITFQHPARGKSAGSLTIWKKDGALRLAKLLEQRGYEARAVLGEIADQPDEPVLKIRIRRK